MRGRSEPGVSRAAPGSLRRVCDEPDAAQLDSAAQAGVDFVLFDDGTYWGGDKSYVLRDVQSEISAERAAREASSVKRTRESETADHARDKYLTARKMEGGSH